MDFTSRGNQSSSPAAPRSGATFTSGSETAKPKAPKFGGDHKYKLVGVSLIVLALLFAAVLGVLFTTKQTSEEALVDNTKLQAVFLTNDQVYFGKVVDINQKYVSLVDIYYLQTASANNQNADNNVSLIKLGCELHQPTDRMVINREQVQFWENLKEDGQVAKAVEKYRADNPNGQTCSTTNTNSGTNVQGSANPTTTSPTTTPTTNSTTNNQNTSNTRQ